MANPTRTEPRDGRGIGQANLPFRE